MVVVVVVVIVIVVVVEVVLVVVVKSSPTPPATQLATGTAINSNHQQFQSSDSDVVAVCGVTTVAPNCFKHGMSTKRISQSFRPQINR